MGVIEFELERTIRAPVRDVFARLSDIEGHNEWMPKKGSILRHTQQTSPGEPALGTTFIDETPFGPTPGEVVVRCAAHADLPLVGQVQVRQAQDRGLARLLAEDRG